MAVGYVRVSTDTQDLGPKAQRTAIEKWCAAKGCTLAAVFEDLVFPGRPTWTSGRACYRQSTPYAPMVPASWSLRSATGSPAM